VLSISIAAQTELQNAAPEGFKAQQSPVVLDLCLRETRAGKSQNYRDYIVIERTVLKVFFAVHTKTQSQRFSKSSRV